MNWTSHLTMRRLDWQLRLRAGKPRQPEKVGLVMACFADKPANTVARELGLTLANARVIRHRNPVGDNTFADTPA